MNLGFRRKLFIELLVVIALYFAVTAGYDLAASNRLTDKVGNYTIHDSSIRADEDLKFELYEDGGMVDVERLWIEDRQIFYTLRGTKPGNVFLIVRNAATGKNLVTEYFGVSRNGKVTNVYTGNYSNCRFHILMNVLFLTLFVIICLIELLRYRGKVLYSYDQMFVGGLLLWLTSTVIIQWAAFAKFQFVFDYYIGLQRSAYHFMLYTAPIVWAFCIALSVSNISLIRHEGYRVRNALGIIISVLLILGSLAGFAAANYFYGTNATQIRTINILISSYCSVYSLFACLLEGAILGGIAAAKYDPPFDCDYIIILGCMIRKDGSLTPLLRGRVDRALKHAAMQEERTGKAPVFVPSGGQGRNEVMSEAAAMKNYLLAQGIPEERILAEDQSTNTAENMRFSKRLIEERMPDARIAFSTTNYHVYRSGIIASQNDFYPEGMGSRTKWYFWPNAFIREFFGMLFYTKFVVTGILVMLIAMFAMIEMMIVRG